jgi:acyl-CoA synthetase (NDP forming)
MLESEIYDWLKKADINTPQYKLFNLNEDVNVDFYPVALKIESPKVIHKSDVGGVVIDIKNQEELKAAKQTILTNIKAHGITLDDNDRLIATQMCKGIELFFGVVTDPVFEKVIVFGTGGIFVELFKDVCFIDSEAGDEEIKKAILQTKISTLFTTGFRGAKYDLAPIIDLIKKLQKIEASELDFNPVILTETSLTVVDARVKFDKPVPQTKILRHSPEIYDPQKIAIIGASQHAEKVGYALAENASTHSDTYFVNPSVETLFGKKVYKTVSELPEVDTAVIAIPAKLIRQTIMDLIPKKVKNIIIVTAGFKEVGEDESFLATLAAEHGLNIIGPNCLGIYAHGINLTFGTSDVKTGVVNLISQSGAILAELMDKAPIDNIGFENIVSVGNMADVDVADLINSYEGSNPLNIYIEGVEHGKNLLRAIRKSKVPINVFKAGKSKAAQKAAFSHTGNLSGNYEMFLGLLKSVGVKFLNDTNGLLYPHQFQKILVVTNAGGAGTVMSDLISDKMYELSHDQIESLNQVLPSNWSKNNPVDIIGEATHERYLATLKVVDGFDADAIYVIITPQFMTDVDQIAEIFLDNKFKTPVFPIFLGGEMVEKARQLLRDKKMPFFEELTDATSFL